MAGGFSGGGIQEQRRRELVFAEVEHGLDVAGQTIKAELSGEVDVHTDATLYFPPEHCFFFGPDGSRLG